MNPDVILAALALVLHLLFILWVISGSYFTPGRPLLRWIHIFALGWGIVFGFCSLVLPTKSRYHPAFCSEMCQ